MYWNQLRESGAELKPYSLSSAFFFLFSWEWNQSKSFCNQRQREFWTKSPWKPVLVATVSLFIHNCFVAKEKLENRILSFSCILYRLNITGHAIPVVSLCTKIMRIRVNIGDVIVPTHYQ